MAENERIKQIFEALVKVEKDHLKLSGERLKEPSEEVPKE